MDPKKIECWVLLEKYDFWKQYTGGRIVWSVFSSSVEQNRDALKKDGFTDKHIDAIKKVRHIEFYKQNLSSNSVSLFLQELDELLTRVNDALEVILVGGTEAVFMLDRVTEDMDLIIPILRMSGIRGRMEPIDVLKQVPFTYLCSRIDVFSSADFPSVSLSDYYNRCLDVDSLNALSPSIHIKLPKFKSLIVRFLHPLDLVCAKIFAGRDKDIFDCEILVRIFALSRDTIISRMMEIDSKETRRSATKQILDLIFQ